jgi:medium-chain acyl-[acyl-carrier-protein] hydrolase
MYEIHGRVRYSEVDSEGILTVPSLINYFQDCSTFQTEDTGFSLSWLKAHGQGWYILSWQIDIDRLPKIGEEIEITTRPVAYKGLYAIRDFTMEYPGQDPFVRARSIWVLMDLIHMRPTLPFKEMKDAYGLDQPAEGKWGGRKLPTPPAEDLKEAGSFLVTRVYLDSNHHMNNEKYVEEAMAVLPEGRKIRGIRTEYRRQAVLGDTVYIYTKTEEGRMTAVLKDAGDVLAVVCLLTQ